MTAAHPDGRYRRARPFRYAEVPGRQPAAAAPVVLDRNRGGAYLSMLIGTAGLFGTILFLTYYCSRPSATRRW